MAQFLIEFTENNKDAGGQLDGEHIETFCGLPHHLYLPKSKKEPGEKFELLAFVNDVSQDVTEGSDGVEHMYEQCKRKQN